MINDVITEWWIDGAWTRVAGSVNLDERVRKSPGVHIERDTSDLSGVFTPASSDFDVNNADGVFSNRNPLSPLFGKIPRYTKVRHRIPLDSGSMDNYVRFFQPDESATLSTTDKAALEVTGDIDIRFEITPDSWGPLYGYAIAGRYAISLGAQRSWIIWLDYLNRFNLRWSADGSTTNDATFSAWPNGTYGYGRQCVRITLDVDNGSGGRTATLYHAQSMSGTWTQIQQITQAGTTSLYGAGTSPLQIANVDNGSPINGQTQFYGKFYSFELRNGINGTLVAKMDASGREIGDTGWSDGLGNTWTMTGTARIASDRIRHVGEMDSIAYNWDETRRNVWLPMKTIGPMSRLQETGQPVRSPIYNTIQAYPNLVGYWTGEQGAGATAMASEASVSASANLTDVSFSGSTPTGLNGSAGAFTLNSATSKIAFGASGRSSNGLMTAFFWFKLSSLPGSDKTLVTYKGNGTVTQWDFKVGAGGFAWVGSGPAGTVVSDSTTFGTGASPLNQWVGMQLTLQQVGGNVNYAWRWFGVDSGKFYINTTGGALYAGTVGRLGRAYFDASTDAAFTGAQFAHFVMAQAAFTINSSTFYDAAVAYNGELAGVRAQRIATENDVELEIYGDASTTQQMGPQPIDTPYNILAECAVVDSAMLFDLRDKFGIGMNTRVFMENRTYLQWSQSLSSNLLAQVPAVIEDGRYTKNDFTVTRPNGGSGRSQQTEGQLSISEPPLGIGVRAGSTSMNAYSDDQVQRLAEYEVFKRTRDELRIPNVVFEINRAAMSIDVDTIERTVAGNLGDWYYIFGLPTFVDFRTFRRMLIVGYSENFDGHLWTITFNTTTADAYRIMLSDFHYIADDLTTTLKVSRSGSDTSFVFVTPTTSRPWLPASATDWEGGYNVYVSGELVTVTNMTDPVVVGSNYEQTATVTRGIGKSLAAGAQITLSENSPFYLGL